jgi:hypothetical protein
MSQGTRIRARLEEIADELRNIEAQRFKLGRLPPWQDVFKPGAIVRHNRRDSQLKGERQTLIDERRKLEHEYERLPKSAR